MHNSDLLSMMFCCIRVLYRTDVRVVVSKLLGSNYDTNAKVPNIAMTILTNANNINPANLIMTFANKFAY